MADLTRRFFLDRELEGEGVYRGRNHLPLATHPTELLLEAFRPGDGKRLQTFLTGKWPTGDAPQKLPPEVANEVAHIINTHRHGDRVAEPGYVVQLVAVGDAQLHWDLEIASVKDGRYSPMHTPAAAEARARQAKGQPTVFKSELDNLFIRHWLRAIHYTINVITFDSVGDMEAWLEHWGLSTLTTKRLHALTPVQEPAAPTPWFQTLGWQRLPEDLIARLDSGARWLVFPTEAEMRSKALKAAPGGLLLLPFTFLWEWIKEHGEHGPHNCVHTLFSGDLRVVRRDGDA